MSFPFGKPNLSRPRKTRAAVLTVSDRCAAGKRPDLGGPVVTEAALRAGWTVVDSAVVADERAAVSGRLRSWCDGAKAPDLILTTGGTGLSPRDVTPEATRDVLDREIPGIAERMRREGERFTPMAALSRALAGSRANTLIVNLPGSPKGARESLAAVAELIEHALHVLKGGDHKNDPS